MAKRRDRRRGPSRGRGLGGLGASLAPWAAAAGFLISFTADAGTEHAPSPGPLAAYGAVSAPNLARNAALLRAAARPTDEAKLQGRMFSAARRGEPPVRVAGLGDPAAALAGGEAAREAAPDGFVASPDLGLGPRLSPLSGHGGDTPGGRDDEGEALATSDGATPAVPKAVALSSVTPAPADAVPMEVAAASLVLPGFSPRLDRAPDAPAATDQAPPGVEAPSPPAAEAPTPPAAEAPTMEAQHRFADLIRPDAMESEQRCLAEAVYFEARSEPEDGQAAVAQVILNRVKSGLYPASVCGVVYQNRHRYMACQFSFACEGKSLRITDAASWQTATRIASAVIDGRTYLSDVGGATHYHANYVRPGWSRRLKRMDVIGRHIFYQLKPGQS